LYLVLESTNTDNSLKNHDIISKRPKIKWGKDRKKRACNQQEINPLWSRKRKGA